MQGHACTAGILHEVLLDAMRPTQFLSIFVAKIGNKTKGEQQQARC